MGLAWNLNDSITAAFDVEHIRYSSVNSVENSFLPNLQTAQLGNHNGAGFGWKDMTIFKFGTQWRQNEDWTWRGGVSYVPALVSIGLVAAVLGRLTELNSPQRMERR